MKNNSGFITVGLALILVLAGSALASGTLVVKKYGISVDEKAAVAALHAGKAEDFAGLNK